MRQLLLIIIFIIVCVILAQTLHNNTTITGGSNKGKRHKQTPLLPNSDVVKDLNEFPASRFETYVRTRIEIITGKKFPCVYPKWLSYKGKRLELDGYNEELKLAFETQGPQHTMFSSKTDPKYIKYKHRVENDKAKIRISEENNVGLIIIDYKVPKYLVGSYIKSRIHDIAERWIDKGLFIQVNKLGMLAKKPGDYVEPIVNVAYDYKGLD